MQFLFVALYSSSSLACLTKSLVTKGPYFIGNLLERRRRRRRHLTTARTTDRALNMRPLCWTTYSETWSLSI
ncbi:hypothetical protein PVAP13_5KG647600 [Panicum virgatum]|uniref:Secreted protein n=1 Tax=Panicum virgatum TaxID=38727 RepID=A0A8T0SYM9_PANVG|nr:hypothetical protein PVAP13_5KG647600 [Panicum virgatum]